MSNLHNNRLSATFTDQELMDLKGHRKDYLSALRDKTVALTPDELDSLNSMAVDNFVFVKDMAKAVDAEGQALLGAAYAAIIPEFQKDVTLFEQLDTEELLLTDVLTRVQHTKRLAAHESYSAATKLYKQFQLQAADGVVGAITRYNLLKERFKTSGGGRPPETEA